MMKSSSILMLMLWFSPPLTICAAYLSPKRSILAVSAAAVQSAEFRDQGAGVYAPTPVYPSKGAKLQIYNSIEVSSALNAVAKMNARMPPRALHPPPALPAPHLSCLKICSHADSLILSLSDHLPLCFHSQSYSHYHFALYLLLWWDPRNSRFQDLSLTCWFSAWSIFMAYLSVIVACPIEYV